MQQNQFTDAAIWSYCLELTSPLSADLSLIKSRTEAEVHGAQMLSDHLVAKLLQMMVFTSRAKVCADLGTYTGFSALAMAEVMGYDGKVFTIDRANQAGHQVAKQAFEESPHGHKITMIIEDALDAITGLPNDLDVVFIDADKKQTQQYVDLLLPKLSPQGVIIVDDVLWRGEVLNPQDPRAQKLDDFNREMFARADIENMILPIRHGLHLIRKKF